MLTVLELIAFIGPFWLIVAGHAELVDMVGERHRKPGRPLSWLSIAAGLTAWAILFVPHFV